MRMGTVCLAIALAGGAQNHAPSTGLQVTHRARALAPGEVVLVAVRSSTPLAALSGAWLDQIVPFHQSGEEWQGLAPIDLAARAGRHTIHLSATTGSGHTLSREHVIVVDPRTFPTRRITVDEKFATPSAEALARTARERQAEEAVFARPPSPRMWREPFVVPVPGKATSSFGRRSIVNGQPRSPHSGTDFQARDRTPVTAPNSGRVALAADHYFPGRIVIIDHGAGVYSYLAHLSEVSVAEGEAVERGQLVGLSGSSGRVTGPHLHWTMRIGRARVDPLSLVSVLGKGP
jgi:murein DD-endopeptidase MepM/ murein hydrolase activator NlpD